MNQDVIMVVEDGSRRGGGVPSNARMSVTVPYGDNFTLRGKVYTSAGVEVDLTAVGVSLVWTWKKYVTDPVAAFSKAGVVNRQQGKNRVDFSLVPNDVRLLQPGRFVHDVWLTTSTSRDVVLPLSPLVLQPSVAPLP